MVAFPHCKINLGLHIISKRNDGFHNIETVLYPLPFTDVLEVITSEQDTILKITGLPVEADENNLCLKAYRLLKKDFPALPPVHIHLHKVIPTGAGLGGGSADASFTLQLLNSKCRLQLTPQQLLDYALQLGSDCPFFIQRRPVFATGRGEIMKEISCPLQGYKILLANPGIHVSTREAFAAALPARPSKSIEEIIKQPVEKWKYELQNDFEKPVSAMYPAISSHIKTLYDHGALYAAMTGTGSTVFGIFPKTAKEEIVLKKDYFHAWVHPAADTE